MDGDGDFRFPARAAAYDWSMALVPFDEYRRRLAVLVAAGLLAAAPAIAQPPPRSPAATLATVLKTLLDEARLAKTEEQLPRQDADFAHQGGQQPLPPLIVGRHLIRRADRDPFVDAYVRWQLTSFEPTLPEMTDREFERFLSELPPMLENPRANGSLLGDINAALGAGALPESTQTALRRRLDTLAAQASRARTMNRPAMNLYDWVSSQLPQTGARALQLQLARLGALVDAGWPSDAAKSRLEELFNASARDRSFTAEQRRLVASQAQRLAGRTRVFLTSARIDQGALVAQFNDTGVYDFDVKRWTRALFRH